MRRPIPCSVGQADLSLYGAGVTCLRYARKAHSVEKIVYRFQAITTANQ
jgi:hypothetical protein